MRSSPRAMVRPRPYRHGLGRASSKSVQKFRSLVWNHYRREGRHALPWRHTRDPYAIVVSEVMLQQTQVARVFKFYAKFLERFPSFRALTHTPRREVLKAWQGLGYNRRAVSLHRLAGEISKKYKGKLPHTREELEKIPGIGPATAGSILAFAFNAPVYFVETNIRRAMLHHFFPRARKVGEKAIMDLVVRTLPKKNPRAWYYALMDYGSALATRVENPNRRLAAYRPQPKFKGSSRELRGNIVRYLLSHPRSDVRTLSRVLRVPLTRAAHTLAALKKEGLAT